MTIYMIILQKAILLTEGYRYNGAKGDIKVWTPKVDFDDDYSTSQVCLVNGPYWAFESVESGWAVYTRMLIITITFHINL